MDVLYIKSLGTVRRFFVFYQMHNMFIFCLPAVCFEMCWREAGKSRFRVVSKHIFTAYHDFGTLN